MRLYVFKKALRVLSGSLSSHSDREVIIISNTAVGLPREHW